MTILLLAFLILAALAVGATVHAVVRDGYRPQPVRAGLPRPDRLDRR